MFLNKKIFKKKKKKQQLAQIKPQPHIIKRKYIFRLQLIYIQTHQNLDSMTGTLLFLARNWRSSKNKKSGNWRRMKGKERRTKKKKKRRRRRRSKGDERKKLRQRMNEKEENSVLMREKISIRSRHW